MALQIGQQAPDFSLFDSDKNKYNLADSKGKNVVILFFPLAFSGVCTKEMCAMQDSLAVYNSLNAEIVGISVDSVFSLAKFKEVYNLNFKLLSDFNKTIAPQYDSLMEDFPFDMKGVTKRSVYVLDKDGVIKHVEICPTPGDMPNLDAIKDVLSSLN